MTYLTAGLAAGALAAGLVAGYQAASLKHERLAEEARQEAAGQAEVATLRARAAARDYEAWRAAQRPRVITITREVERVLQVAPGWSDVELPDRLRSTLEAAAASLGAAEPEPTVPPVPDPRTVKEL